MRLTIARLRTLVSSNWLREELLGAAKKSQKEHRLRVLDTSWVPAKEVNGYEQFYMNGHIPGAAYFDLHRCVESTPLIPRNLPDIDCFEDHVRSLGINNDTHVVAYDRFNTRPSVRTWWLFRLLGHEKISILDGGLRKWFEDGYEITTDVPEIEKGDFKVKGINAKLIRNMDAMVQNIEIKAEQVLDARDTESFIGEDESSEDKTGHLPGARNLPFSSVFNEDGTFRSEKDLKLLFNGCGIDLGRPLVAMCQTGMTACALAAAAHILGKNEVPIYYGSWNEWSQLASDELCVTGK